MIYIFPVRGIKRIKASNVEDAIRQYKELVMKPKTQITILFHEEDIQQFRQLEQEEKPKVSQ